MALSPERQSARSVRNYKCMLDLDGAEHSKCNHMMVLGFKGLRGKLVTDPKIVRVYKLQVRSYGRLGGRAFKEMFAPRLCYTYA